MKKLLFLAVLILSLTACEKNCDEEKLELYNQYVENLQYTGGNQAASAEMYRQYQEKLRKLEERCD